MADPKAQCPPATTDGGSPYGPRGSHHRSLSTDTHFYSVAASSACPSLQHPALMRAHNPSSVSPRPHHVVIGEADVSLATTMSIDSSFYVPMSADPFSMAAASPHFAFTFQSPPTSLHTLPAFAPVLSDVASAIHVYPNPSHIGIWPGSIEPVPTQYAFTTEPLESASRTTPDTMHTHSTLTEMAHMKHLDGSQFAYVLQTAHSPEYFGSPHDMSPCSSAAQSPQRCIDRQSPLGSHRSDLPGRHIPHTFSGSAFDGCDTPITVLSAMPSMQMTPMSLVSPIVAPSRSNSSSSAASPDLAATHLASRKRSFAKVAEPALTPGSPLAESSDASEAAFSPSASSRRSSKKRRSDFHAPIYRRWTHQEDALLRNAVAEFGSKSNWAKVAQQVPGRSAMQCSTRWSGALNPAIKKGKWTKESDESLIAAYTKAVEAVGGNKEAVNWSSIAECVPGRTGVQCMARYLEALDPSVRKGKWGAEEDQLLRTGLKELGLRWVELAKRIPGRTQRQCRTRWIQIRDTLSEDGGRYYSRPSKRKKTSRDSAAWPGSVRASHADLLSTDTTSMELHPECDIYAEIKAESPDEPSSWDVGASDSFSDSFGDDTDLPPTSVSQQNSQLYFYSGSSDMPSLMMDGI